MNIHPATSGYHYEDFEGVFYPENLEKDKWLRYYSKHFYTLEINNTFYNLPEKETIEKWDAQTPDDFIFSIKASRYITHMKKLNMDDELLDAIEKFYKCIEALKEKISFTLWQLPGNLHRDVNRLDKFLESLDHDHTNVIEFRHNSWFSEKVNQCLKAHQALCCTISGPDKSLPDRVFVENKTAYVRMHGLSDWYEGEYSENELRRWIGKLKDSDAERVFMYFNNTKDGYAVKNALSVNSFQIKG